MENVQNNSNGDGKASFTKENEFVKSSTMSSAFLRIFGYVEMVLGVVGSINMGVYYESFWISIGCVIGALALGFSFIGFAEMIDLLSSINRKLEKKKD